MVAVQLKPQAADAGTHVVFHMLPVLDEAASHKAGRPIYNDIEHCMISFAGNRQTIGDFPALDFADWQTDPVMGTRTQRTYAEKYNAEYLAFKAGDAKATGGTPLEELTFLTQGKRLELKALHIHTAEALASLDGNNLKMLGIGGRELKDQAQTYLDVAAKGADATYLRNELAQRDARLAELEARLATFDRDGDGKPGGSVKVTAEATSEVEEAFKDHTDEDLDNWLMEAGVAVDKRWSRKTKIEKAEAILAQKGKKNAAAA